MDNFVLFPKNPNIARVFKEIGRADELGSGIEYLKKNEYINNSTARELIGLANSTTKRLLSKMVKVSNKNKLFLA